MGGDKLAIDIDGRSLLRVTLGTVAATSLFDTVVVVVAEDHWAQVGREAAAAGIGQRLRLVAGGARRQDSVAAGLPCCGDVEIICVHDAARPLCPPSLFASCVDAARVHGAATAALPVVDSIKRVDVTGLVLETLARGDLVAVQTPQAFSAELLRRAHRQALDMGWEADDDCALVERMGAPVVVVPGDPRNLKVTRPADIAVVRACLGAAAP